MLRYKLQKLHVRYSIQRFATKSEADRILSTYGDKIKHKAKSEGLSVNNLIHREVPRDEVMKTRKVEQVVSQERAQGKDSWRKRYGTSGKNSVFISVPWLQKKD
ncbi:hypothetical protein MIR68_012154 [Amoeboaphelidium protococcarum]|nr:hypothetical protein MIR68_012154 [Amoeboaphelidium protococcarum]